MAGNTFEDLLSEVEDIGGEFELDELIGGMDTSDLDFDDDLTGTEHLSD